MARFPNREADVAALASDLAHGLTQYAEDFPAPPVTPEDIKTALEAYVSAREKAVAAQGVAAEAFDVKNDALDDLIDNMKAAIRYAEDAVDYDDAKLKLIGWGGRRPPSSLESPGQARVLEVFKQGQGWLYLDWKEPSEGGRPAAYRIQCRHREQGDWKDVAMAVESEILLTGQERAVELEYHVIAVNRAGQGEPSNTVTAVL
jgi:hypothetical protein